MVSSSESSEYCGAGGFSLDEVAEGTCGSPRSVTGGGAGDGGDTRAGGAAGIGDAAAGIGGAVGIDDTASGIGGEGDAAAGIGAAGGGGDATFIALHTRALDNSKTPTDLHFHEARTPFCPACSTAYPVSNINRNS